MEHAARELEAERPDAPPEEGVGTLLGPILGMTYTSTAIIPDGVAAYPGLDLTGRPGTRLPHRWVERNGQRLSTLDLIGDRFTLLVGPDGHAWCDRVSDHELVLCLIIGDGGAIHEITGTWTAAAGIGARGAVLVRPDGIIAWRAQQGGEGQITDIDSIVQRVLGQLAD